MCTRFYVEPDTEEIREIIAEVQRSQLSGKFIKAGNAIGKKNCFPNEMGISDTR